jgi:hypothetical protein
MAVQLQPAFAIPTNFKIHQVPTAPPGHDLVARAALLAPPPLGPLSAFTGTWTGSGFNTIFRPQTGTTTLLPIQVPGDNVLELNLTSETLSFSPSLGSIPNRGTAQGDLFMNGVPYIQSISDVTNPGQSTGIHFEPGIWLSVPATTVPAEGITVARMASIPHGTTIEAQGIVLPVAGGPQIDPVDITPTVIATGVKVPKFPSQTALNQQTARIPQDLSPFMLQGTITQDLLDDPNSLLRNQIAGQNILSTTVLIVATNPAPPSVPAALFGGGTANTAFLLGDPAAQNPNAQAIAMSAIFWIETVEYILQIPAFGQGQGPINIQPDGPQPFGRPIPTFVVNPPIPVPAPMTLKVTGTQIQYTQTVMLNFSGLSWPHVSVATLVPSEPITIPDSAWLPPAAPAVPPA